MNRKTWQQPEQAAVADDKSQWRQHLIAYRKQWSGREAASAQLQQVLTAWLAGDTDVVVGAYWPIRGEFDPLPVLRQWRAHRCHLDDGGLPRDYPQRRIALPVVDVASKTLRFHHWYDGCTMGHDAYGIPHPLHTDVLHPTLLLVPCVGYMPGGYRLGYGGGFYDRTLAASQPRPTTVGLAFAHSIVPHLRPQPHDVPLDAILTEDGLAHCTIPVAVPPPSFSSL